LPDTLKKQVIATIPWDLDNTDKDFLTKVRPFLEKAERDQEKRLYSVFLGELKRGGLAKSGFESVYKALQNGQVDTLILGEDLAQEKKETLTSLAQATNAYIEFIPSKTRSLDQINQVGALLRWAM
jgi:peptide subunit release factor 1 (eRF1)